MLKREGRYEDFQRCLDFLPTRAKLDLIGFPAADIFSH
jgi:ribonuclease D